MKLVKFNNGKFGVRLKKKWLEPEKFMDLVSPEFSWRIDFSQFRHCQGSEEEARAAKDKLVTTYEIIN